MTDDGVPDEVRPYYEDAIRVLEAVGAAHPKDVKTARRALQFTTPILRNLFQVPTASLPVSPTAASGHVVPRPPRSAPRARR